MMLLVVCFLFVIIGLITYLTLKPMQCKRLKGYTIKLNFFKVISLKIHISKK